MTDKSRAAFEAWYRSDDDESLTDNAPSINDLDAHHKYWMLAAWETSRKQALEEAAQTCKDTAEACVSLKRFNLLTDAGKAIYDAMSKGALNCEAAIRRLI